ncbi:MAG TPA: hypothetical protein VNW99_11665, partial [Cytophagaceae bacterium]|nr:hypothetical protein [Cytophagaceae bacterium]
MRRLLFFTAVLSLPCFFFEAAAQDIIVKKNGEEFKTKIVQVDDTLVKYKNFDDPEFVTFSMPSSEIKMIKYENGKRKIFGIDLAQSYISILGGIANPTGDYSSSDLSRSDQGLAKSGRYNSIDGCFYLKNKKWGLGFDLTSFSNGYNSSQIDRNFKQNLSQNETVVTKYGKYSGAWLAIGPQYSSKLNQWITWDIRYAWGIMGFTKPSFQYTYHDKNSSSIAYNSRMGLGISLVRTFSTGLRFHLSKRLALKLFVQIASSNSTVKFNTDLKQTDSTGAIVFSDFSTHKKLIRYGGINIGIGLTYQFGSARIKPDNRKMYGRFPQSYFGIMIGPASPISSYASSSFGNSNAGLAKHGTSINIEACHYFKEKKWGIGFELAGFKNQFDYNRVDQYLRGNQGYNNNNNETVYTSYGDYKGGWLAAGPQFSPKISRWAIWDLKASLGIMGLSKPSLHYTYYDASANRLEYDLSS